MELQRHLLGEALPFRHPRLADYIFAGYPHGPKVIGQAAKGPFVICKTKGLSSFTAPFRQQGASAFRSPCRIRYDVVLRCAGWSIHR